MNPLFLSFIFYALWICTSIAHYCHEKPLILIIQGNSSAGKTSTCKALLELNSSFNEKWIHIDEDQLRFDMELQKIKTTLPKEFALLKNSINHFNTLWTIQQSEIYFKLGLTQQEKLAARKVFKKLRRYLQRFRSYTRTLIIPNMLNTAINNNQSVILDIWRRNPNHIKKSYSQCTVVSILIINSLHSAIERTIHRNSCTKKRDDMANQRIYKHVLCNYLNWHCFYTHPIDTAIAHYTITELHRLLDRIVTESHNAGFHITKEEIDAFQQKCMLSHCSPDDILYVAPKNTDYDYIINTDNITPQEAAKQIMHSIQNHLS